MPRQPTLRCRYLRMEWSATLFPRSCWSNRCPFMQDECAAVRSGAMAVRDQWRLYQATLSRSGAGRGIRSHARKAARAAAVTRAGSGVLQPVRNDKYPDSRAGQRLPPTLRRRRAATVSFHVSPKVWIKAREPANNFFTSYRRVPELAVLFRSFTGGKDARRHRMGAR